MFVDMYNITFVDMMELKFVISILFTCSFSSVYSIYRWIKKGCQVNGFDNPVLRLCLYMAFCEDDEESLPYDLIRREILCSDMLYRGGCGGLQSNRGCWRRNNEEELSIEDGVAPAMTANSYEP